MASRRLAGRERAGACGWRTERKTPRGAIVRVAATTLFSVWSMGWLGASCGDRPGTPDMVHAEARDATDAEGRRIREIVFSWRNTARHGEQVWWDIEMKDGAGRVIPQRAGSGRPSSMYHDRLFNAFLVGPRTTRCFRIKARTGAGTQGCVSQSWSAEVCATSSRAVDGVRLHPFVR
jgi:hypothetical protein